MIELWTDGSTPVNPGPGAWAAILVHESNTGKRTVKPMAGGVPGVTTNNAMELLAVIKGLEALQRPCTVRVCSDSTYVVNAFEKGWLARWQRNGWRNAAGKPVANAELWRELAEHAGRHAVEWRHVRGHRGIPLNERADRLAALAVPLDRRSAQRLLDLERDLDWFLTWAA